MKKFWMLVALLVAVSAGQAAEDITSTFENMDFEESGGNQFTGFDSPTDIAGWVDISVEDGGVENSSAWWGTYEGFSSFIVAGGAAYNPGTYVIKKKDTFTFSFYAKSWDADSQWTVSLIYGDDPANVIGDPFVVDLTADAWAQYTSSEIEASATSVGKTLGIKFENTGSGFANMDNIEVSVEGTVRAPALYVIK